ncbi:MAG TPA: cytochrome c [Cyclobacteriaceae bacterium]|nr:cytochrome c [Cyclobacteriaceae bacterium]
MLKLVAIAVMCSISVITMGQKRTDLQSSIARGKAVFENTCLACHQADASGVPNLAPPLIKTSFVLGDKTKLINIILNGLKDVEIDGERYDNPMPAFDYLTDTEVADVLTYVRNNFGNKAGVVKAEEVAIVRKSKKKE